MAEIIKPTFLTSDFIYGQDILPLHNNERPRVAHHPDLTFRIGSAALNYNYMVALAVDIVDLDIARDLVAHRIDLLTSHGRGNGETENLYLISPNRDVEMVFMGLRQFVVYEM